MIALITPTGCRVNQFDICQYLMYRQTYQEKVVWVIVDDGLPRTTDQVTQGFRDNWHIIKTYPTPAWSAGQNTQGRNLEAGITALLNAYKLNEIDAVFIIEDDDYYRPRYLERMMTYWGDCLVLGETKTIYYNPVIRHFSINNNTTYASLFQTAFAPSIVQQFLSVKKHKFIDGEFWKIATGKKLFYEDDLAVGIKGLPGRAGIGAGHAVNYYGMMPDREMKFLLNKIGEDARLYQQFYKLAPINRPKRRDLLNRR